MKVHIDGIEKPVMIEDSEADWKEIIKQSDLIVTQTEFGKSRHFRSIKGGFEMEFVAEKLETLFIYYRTNKIESFQGLLPFRINSGWKVKGAVMYMGEPPKKPKKSV